MTEMIIRNGILEMSAVHDTNECPRYESRNDNNRRKSFAEVLSLVSKKPVGTGYTEAASAANGAKLKTRLNKTI